jgi:hypothetical protein
VALVIGGRGSAARSPNRNVLSSGGKLLVR